MQRADANTPPLITRLLPRITEVLGRYEQDPAALCGLAARLLRPLTLAQVVPLAPEAAVVRALRSPAPSANLLAVAVLGKAAASAADAAVLAATMRDAVAGLVACWLAAPQVEVGEAAARVLGDLLDVDCDARPPGGAGGGGGGRDGRPPVNGDSGGRGGGAEIVPARKPPGQGLMWRRIFHDRDIYGLIISLCGGGGGGDDDDDGGPQRRPDAEATGPRLSDQQRTLAQGRLLRILPRLAVLNLPALARTDFPDLHRRYGDDDDDDEDEDSNAGLLQLAALHMVDRGDRLMHLCLVDFFETLLSTQRVVIADGHTSSSIGGGSSSSSSSNGSSRMEILRGLVARATARDDVLRAALLSLPDRTVPEEADELRTFIRDVMPST